jgi:hypothetical protein
MEPRHERREAIQMAGILLKRREDGQTEIHETAVGRLRERLTGDLLLPGDRGYDDARRVFNAMIDRRPGLIARCSGVADVVEAVRFARDHDLLTSVRGGGHNVSGNAVGDGAFMIDLTPMAGIRVDPSKQTVRAGPGLTWRQFDRETQAVGLATTGGVISSTGIAGLTLGGGIGYLARLHGLSCDNLISADVVTANGEVVTASTQDHPDLFWGLRGGGANFGVVTSFEYRLHEVREVTGGLILHPVGRARDGLRFYRDFMLTAPDALTVHAGLLTLPDGTKVLVFVVGCIAEGREAEAMLRPLREFGPPMTDLIRPMSYVELQQLLDASYPPGLYHYWKSSFLARPDDEALGRVITHFLEAPSPQSHVIIERLGGAVERIPPQATAFAYRTMPFDLFILGVWTNREEQEACVTWARDLWRVMDPFLGEGAYVNYLGGEADEGPDRIRRAYGGNYDRLAMIKTTYDPENRFRLNQNIIPAL